MHPITFHSCALCVNCVIGRAELNHHGKPDWLWEAPTKLRRYVIASEFWVNAILLRGLMTEFHMYKLSDCLLISQATENSENLLLRRTVSIGRRLGRVLLLFAAISQVSPACLGALHGCLLSNGASWQWRKWSSTGSYGPATGIAYHHCRLRYAFNKTSCLHDLVWYGWKF